MQRIGKNTTWSENRSLTKRAGAVFFILVTKKVSTLNTDDYGLDDDYGDEIDGAGEKQQYFIMVS